MGIKTILVFCDTSPHCEGRLKVAIELARKHEAHLVGTFVRGQIVVPAYMEAGIGADLILLQEKRLDELEAKGKALFERVTNASGIACEWRATRGDVYEQAAMHARYADLVVMSQYDPKLRDPDIVPDLAEMVAMDSGRPVLVVPYIGAKGPLGDHVMVAWNSSREATRAVKDSIPFLKRAKQVTVLSVDPHGGAAGHGEQPGADVALYLARHGIKVTASQTMSDKVDAGDIILSRAADLNVDLIVMGAYGHSRLREMVIGGVTRKIMSSMTVPVLISH